MRDSPPRFHTNSQVKGERARKRLRRINYMETRANAIEHAQNTWATAAPMSGARHVDRAHPFTGRLQRPEPLLIGAGRGGDPAGSQTGFGKQRLVSGVELWRKRARSNLSGHSRIVRGRHDRLQR